MPDRRVTTREALTDCARPFEGDGPALRLALRPRGPVHLILARRPVEGGTIIEAAGELDVLTASRLGAEIDQVVRRRAGDVALDLRRADFVDSTALQLLLIARRRLARQQRALTVVCDPGPVKHTIARARLLDALGVVSTAR